MSVDSDKHIAINLLCSILDRVPEKRRSDAITFACIAVGQSAERTGLKATRNRPIKHLFWDVTADDLRRRMVHLVDEVGVCQQAIVQGVIAFLDSHFARQSDPNFVERARQNLIKAIDDITADLELPVDQRKFQMSDLELHDLIQKTEDSLADSEQRRLGAQEALLFLREQAEAVFSQEFWVALTTLEIGDPRNLLDGLTDDEE